MMSDESLEGEDFNLTATVNMMNEEEQRSSKDIIMEDYKKLDERCELVLNKIRKRKNNNQNAEQQGQ